MIRNIRTAMTMLDVLAEYSSWLAQSKLLSRAPVKRFQHSVKLSGFWNFSKYLSSDKYTRLEEVEPLTSLDYARGPILDIGANVSLMGLLFALARSRASTPSSPVPERQPRLRATLG